MRKDRLTDNVRAKIAFEVFSTKKSTASIASEFGIARSTVSLVAKEYGVVRGKSRPGGISCSKPGAGISDTETVNWTFDDKLIQVRIKRKEQALVEQVHDSMSALAKLS